MTIEQNGEWFEVWHSDTRIAHFVTLAEAQDFVAEEEL